MLSYTDLKKGVHFIKDGEPYEVLEASFSRMQQRKAVVQSKIRNLITGKVTSTNFQPSDQFDEAVIEKEPIVFLFAHRNNFMFSEPGNPKNRFSIPKEIIGEKADWLKQNTELHSLIFDGHTIGIALPIKIDFIVKEAPPGVQGDRSQGGSKTVVLENGTTVQAPLFINAGDSIRINTETGEYTERAEKAN